MKMKHPCSMALNFCTTPIHQKPSVSILSPKFCNFMSSSSSCTAATTVTVLPAAAAERNGGDSTQEESTFTFSSGIIIMCDERAMYAYACVNFDHDLSEGSSSSARTQLDLLDQLTSTGSSSVTGYDSDGRSTSSSSSSSSRLTIRDQLTMLIRDRDYKDQDFSIPLGKNLKKFTPKFLTVSQKRNIKRQSYLTDVSKRNDSVLFATIGAFVILPPLIILGVCIATGYIQLLP